MMATKSVCLFCRHRLAVTPILRNPTSRWLSAGPGHKVPPLQGNEEAQSPHRVTRTVNQPQGQLRKTPLPRRTSNPIAIFEDIVGQQTQLEAAPRSSVAQDVSLFEKAGKLHEMMMQREISTVSCLDFLRTQIYPAIRSSGAAIPKVLDQQIHRLLDRIAAEKLENVRGKDLPSVVEILQLHADFNYRFVQRWSALTIKLLECLCSGEALVGGTADGGAVEEMNLLIRDLISSWKMLSKPKHIVLRHTSANHGQLRWNLPTTDPTLLRRYSRPHSAHLAFASLFPQYPPAALRAVMPAAIATFSLLTDASKMTPEFREEAGHEATPFLVAVAQVLVTVQIETSTLEKALVAYPSVGQYIMSRWRRVNKHTKHKAVAAGEKHQDILALPEVIDESGMDNIHRQLSQAVSMRNQGEIVRLWDMFIGSSTSGGPAPSKAAELKLRPATFDYFVYAAAATRQSELAGQIISLMEKIGLSPSVRTWTSMMDGLKRCRNADGIRNVWTQLVNSGQRLDEKAWTSRISGLVDCGQTEAAIEALVEMASLWALPEKERPPSAVKPSIQPVNTVVNGLLNNGNTGAANTVLAWAANQGIEPDIFTFNSLLRSLIRAGKNEEIEKLFDLMNAQGVKADDATFTILLEDFLGQQLREESSGHHHQGDLAASPDTNDAQQPQPQAIKTTRHILALMDTLGLATNMHAYNKLVYLLLQHSGAHGEAAADLVLAHISARGLVPTPHLYTILVDHHLSGPPRGKTAVTGQPTRPNVAAIETLIARHNLESRRDMDRVFWERVTAGYARAGEACKAWDVYTRVIGLGASTGHSSRNGAAAATATNASATTTTRPFTLASLEELLLALLRAEMWAEARALVDASREQHVLMQQQRLGTAAAGSVAETNINRHWKHGFWHVAVDAGLLEREWLEARLRGGA